MVALLVGMSIAAIWMTAALPAWRQQAQRQKEEDLIFRGEQYARAIVLYMPRIAARIRRASTSSLISTTFEEVEGSDYEQGLHPDGQWCRPAWKLASYRARVRALDSPRPGALHRACRTWRTARKHARRESARPGSAVGRHHGRSQ
jgi:hypothetical protein